jgi:hypothetical protein
VQQKTGSYWLKIVSAMITDNRLPNGFATVLQKSCQRLNNYTITCSSNEATAKKRKIAKLSGNLLRN